MSPTDFTKILKSMGIKSICHGCGWEIDPETCHCGEPREGGHCDNHTFVPQGCTCFFSDAEARQNPDKPDIEIHL
jgi:hypothetical protein